MQDQAINENGFYVTPQTYWSDDRPIYVTLAGSGFTAAALVPVLLALWGPIPILQVIYVAALLGLLIGMAGLFTAGLMINVIRFVRTQQDAKAAKSDHGRLGKLAFN